MANSEDLSDKAFAGSFELFSKPIKSPQKAFRTYQLTFENGEPVFTLSEVDRILEEVLKRYLAKARTSNLLVRRHGGATSHCSARRRKEAAATSPKTAKQLSGLS